MFTGNKDVDIKILNDLDDYDLSNICVVNKYISEICSTDNFWKTRFQKIYSPYLKNIDILKYKGQATWKEYYLWLSKAINDSYPYFMSAFAVENGRDDILILLEKIKNINNVKSIILENKQYYTRNGSIDGIKEGKYVEWYPNGNILFLKEYKNGLPHGKSSVFLENGDLLMEVKEKWSGNPVKLADFDGY